MKKGAGAGLIIVIIILIAILAIAFFAWGQNFRLFGLEKKPTGLYCAGTKGLAASFLPGAPPPTVYPGDVFDIDLLIENKGETDVAAGAVKILLSGANPFGLVGPQNTIKSNLNEPLDATAKANGCVPAGRAYISYEGASYSAEGPLTSASPIALSADVCYPYESKAATRICATRSKESTICNSTGPRKNIEASGAPVGVTSISQKRSQYRDDGTFIARTEIKAKFSGEGSIYASGTCGAFNNPRTITLKSIKIGTETYTRDEQPARDLKSISQLCGTDIINLNIENEGSIICDLTISNVLDDFEIPIEITLSYMHVITINTRVSVIPLSA